jgi:hypothetical protein
MFRIIRQKDTDYKVKFLQNPSQMNGESMDNVTHEASRTFITRKMEYLKNKINELETNSKDRNTRHMYRGTN